MSDRVADPGYGRRYGALARAAAQESEPRGTAGRETTREDRRRSIAR
jgi:hypothetical protein